ncbi:MAG: PQQ-like beta-propeller repeat protein [Bacteroidetes bacterium]|nr:PQQ-like beta-propeller repeat protein [Bacteroidota bacterium]
MAGILLLSACDSTNPDIPPGAPRILSGTDSVSVDERVTVTVVAEDPRGRPLTYEVDWGDARDMQTIPGIESGLFHELTWQYFDPGSYEMRCRVIDADGRISAWSATFSIVVTGEAVFARGDWWMFMRDAQHSGHSRFQGPGTPVLKWRHAAASPIRSSAVFDAAGTAYFGSNNFLLQAVYADGRYKWQYRTGNARIPNTPALSQDGALQFGSSSANIYRVNRYGLKEWNVSVNAPILSSSAVVDRDGNMYIGSEDCSLYCVSGSGSIRWSVLTNGAVSGSPALSRDEQYVYVGSQDRLLYAVSRNGDVAWTAVTGAPITGSPSVGPDETIYIGSEDGFLSAYNPDGSLYWKRDLHAAIRTTPAVTREGIIHTVTIEGKLFALDGSGTVLWDVIVAPSGGEASPIVDVIGRIYIGGPDGRLTAISSSGRIIWRFDTAWPIQSTASIGEDGSIAFGNDGGEFFVLRER